jgi:DNA-binding beta-propeller fold protein YncE
VNAGIYPTGVVIAPFTNSNIMNQSTQATFNATEDTEVEEANLSSSEEKKAIELNNSNNNNSESDNDSGSSGNDSSKNNSTPCFVLFESLICLYGGWRLRKR